MENKKRKIGLLRLKVVLGIWADIMEGYIGRFKRKNDLDENRMYPTITQVVEVDDSILEEYGIESESEITTPSYYDYLTEEMREVLSKKNADVQRLFSNKYFLSTFSFEDHRYVTLVIEKLYYDGLIDSEIFKSLVQSGYITLTDEDIAHFMKIGLIPIQNSTGGNGSSLT